jgi:hypothetical protein
MKQTRHNLTIYSQNGNPLVEYFNVTELRVEATTQLSFVMNTIPCTIYFPGGIVIQELAHEKQQLNITS